MWLYVFQTSFIIIFSLYLILYNVEAETKRNANTTPRTGSSFGGTSFGSIQFARWRDKAAAPALEELSLLLRNNSPNCIYFTAVKGHKVKGNKNCIQLDNSIKINLSRWHSC